MEVSFIITISVILLIILLSVIFRKLIKLKLLQIKYGKYSYKYVSKFKKFTNKSPFPYCFKDDIMPYLRLMENKRENADIYFSEKNVLFEDTPLSIKANDLLKTRGEPDCFNIFKIKELELLAYGYRIEKFGTSTKAVFFFLKDEYVMGEYIIDDVSNVDINSVAEKILQNTGVSTENKSTLFYVDCKNKTSVFFYENGFSILIRYVNATIGQLNEIME
ncbi:MAG: hypothetical protein B6D61_09710 [Bacteroidetes bacterium 4484_249]|nr:MAG: hypothetical protein B6D61_09710 [Bacteroidetes bacterium 4484_249]